MRVTKSQLVEKVGFFRSTTGIPLVIEWAYGRPRVYVEEGPGYRDLSPRLPMGELDVWLDAWGLGFYMGQRKKNPRGNK